MSSKFFTNFSIASFSSLFMWLVLMWATSNCEFSAIWLLKFGAFLAVIKFSMFFTSMGFLSFISTLSFDLFIILQ
uniref:Uncharacterized protein n=1 Tax=Panstrongylus lignarius TaxID=156445 RepID=A0A224XTK4_9HEMI